ncbi:ROK family protein [Lacisediminihabitans sp.]|uniref:ROK family transcriptional regulator n=1 Tax=Lacisediminihabitans sp. TaxID=2787631 RepID=UPI00374DC263
MNRMGALQGLRVANTELVMRCIESRPLSQAEIAIETGLSAPLVSSIVHQLVAEGVATTTPGVRNGRRATIVSVDVAITGTVAGVALERHGFRLATWSPHGVDLRWFPWDEAVAAQVEAEPHAGLRQVEARLLELDRLDAVAMSAPGWSSSREMRPRFVTTSLALPRWWAPQSAVEELRSSLGCEVFTLNDASAAARAEHRMGAATAFTSFLYLYLSGGVGGALFIEGKMVDGDHGFAGELGHIQVTENGPRCHCGNRGCLELFVGEHALLEPLRRRSPAMAAATLDTLVELASAGDPFCRRTLSEAGEDIGRALAQMLRFLDIRNAVVGGPLAEAGSVIVQPLREQVSRLSVFQPYDTEDIAVTVTPGLLGADASAIGAMLLAAESVGMRSAPELKNTLFSRVGISA